MWFYPANLTPRRIAAARAIAIAADITQWALSPLLVEGFFSPLNDLLDLTVCGAMIWLLGWHIAFLPSFLIKELPLADMAPTWTLAVFFATGRGRPARAVESVEIASAPLSDESIPPSQQIDQRPRPGQQ